MVMIKHACRYLFLCAASVIAMVACNNDPLVAPVASTISLSAETIVLQPGGATQVTAIVTEEAGTPVHNGTVVWFSATMGRMEPESAQTENGVARAIFIAGNTPGTGRVVASSGAAASASDPTNAVEIAIGVEPTASLGLAVSPTNPIVGQPVTLTVTPTVATNGAAPNVEISWGDGTSTDLSLVATPRTASHVYRDPGTYTIRATAVAERTTTSAMTITVGIGGTPSVNVIGNPLVPARCAPVTFTATVTMPQGDITPIERYEWDIRSGTSSENEAFNTNGNIMTRVFRTTGTKTVTVVVVTSDGRRGSSQTQVSVRELTATETCN